MSSSVEETHTRFSDCKAHLSMLGNPSDPPTLSSQGGGKQPSRVKLHTVAGRHTGLVAGVEPACAAFPSHLGKTSRRKHCRMGGSSEVRSLYSSCIWKCWDGTCSEEVGQTAESQEGREFCMLLGWSWLCKHIGHPVFCGTVDKFYMLLFKVISDEMHLGVHVLDPPMVDRVHSNGNGGWMIFMNLSRWRKG